MTCRRFTEGAVDDRVGTVRVTASNLSEASFRHSNFY